MFERYTQPETKQRDRGYQEQALNYFHGKVVNSRQMIDNRRLSYRKAQHAAALKPDSSSESNDLRNAGLKVTLPRLKILDILADGSARHMSAEDIYKKLLVSNEDIGLATVYRVLTQFETAMPPSK